MTNEKNSAIIPKHVNGRLAQLGEHLPYKQRVTGSSPVLSTKKDSEFRFDTQKAGSKGKRCRANFRWTFATVEDRARSSRENRALYFPPRRIQSFCFISTVLAPLLLGALNYGLVAQLVRALACHARGRGFEPHPSRHNEQSNRSKRDGTE